MAGKLYGVGVGPGDPRLMTLKAKDVIEAADVIAVPVAAAGEKSTALSIASQAADLSGKQLMEVVFSMERSALKREIYRKKAAETIRTALDKGLDVAMVVLGDISIYSTYMYVYRYLKDCGYATEMIPGIPSFCAGAAAAQIPLVEGNEQLMVISSLKNRHVLKDALEHSENVVVMKAGSGMNYLPELLEEEGLSDKTVVLGNVGLPGEYVGPPDKDIPYGYFTTLIVKKGGL